MREHFARVATWVSELAGAPWTFLLAVATIALWGVSGPIFGYSDSWQLVINTGTTIVTFLMVFLIQNTQNRDAKAIHLKLDELIRAAAHARTECTTFLPRSKSSCGDIGRSRRFCAIGRSPVVKSPSSIPSERMSSEKMWSSSM